eukprot:TRINITY_DN3630_c0_g2_i1.p1 TRINITY_DN3630_c0_g2~~TRINITY_DN3630_c0_g2_i1.p1  ORF type:complete len:1254 (-),score=450.47 TRINITY_DN3630_c0_g2_i1:473-4234(-)
MKNFSLLFQRLLLFSCLSSCLLRAAAFEASTTNKLHVHIIPHSHCDPGWLKTYQEYYSHHVDRILSGVVGQLIGNPKRTFNWAEISFFKLWWERQDISMKEKVRQLVASGQLEFIGGGWIQNDEATVNYDMVVNQITEGHEYLLKHFNTRPRIGWQVDPFGHSSLTPTVFQRIGYEALVINRIHHMMKGSFKDSKHMEFVWRGSPTLGETSEIFTHVLHTHYAAPIGFDWEENGIIGPNQGRADTLVRILKDRAASYQTNQLLVPWGDDFKFQQAELQFSNMGDLIDYVNSNPQFGVDIQFSTLSRYFDAVKEYLATSEAASLKFPVYKNDFFPYADNEDSYWTGYYASRPVLKSVARETESVLRAAEISHALARSEPIESGKGVEWDRTAEHLRNARWVSALVQHHDGVTGTSRQYVVQDYIQLLEEAKGNAIGILARMSEVLLAKGSTRPELRPLQASTVFDVRSADTGTHEAHPIVVYNSLAWPRTEFVRIRVSSANVLVINDKGQPVPSQVLPVWGDMGGRVQDDPDSGQFELQFEVEVPPLGLATYFLTRNTIERTPSDAQRKRRGVRDEELPMPSQHMILRNNLEGQRGDRTKRLGAAGDQYIENDFVRLSFGADGCIQSLWDKQTNATRKFEFAYLEYQTQRSGAYIFRSIDGPTDVRSQDGVIRLHLVKGPLVQEAHRHFGAFSHVIRLRNSEDPVVGRVIELVHTVTPSDVNRETVIRFSTDIANERTFFTENGLESVERQYKPERPVHANYFPTTSTAFLRDSSTQFSVFTRQTVGVSSPNPGQLELMLHRALGQDDGRGLSEAANDRAPATVHQWLYVDRASQAEQNRKRLQLHLEHPLRIVHGLGQAEGYKSWTDKYNAQYLPLTAPLPAAVHVLSFKSRDFASDEIVIRLQNILEAEPSSNPAKAIVPLDALLARHGVHGIRPLTVTLNQDPAMVRRYNYPVANELRAHQALDGQQQASRPADRQNAEEEGVFISKIALEEKAKLDAAAQGQQPPQPVQTPPPLASQPLVNAPAGKSVINLLAQSQLPERGDAPPPARKLLEFAALLSRDSSDADASAVQAAPAPERSKRSGLLVAAEDAALREGVSLVQPTVPSPSRRLLASPATLASLALTPLELFTCVVYMQPRDTPLQGFVKAPPPKPAPASSQPGQKPSRSSSGNSRPLEPRTPPKPIGPGGIAQVSSVQQPDHEEPEPTQVLGGDNSVGNFEIKFLVMISYAGFVLNGLVYLRLQRRAARIRRR